MNMKHTHRLALLALVGGMALATACTDDAVVPDGGNPKTDAAPVGRSITLRASLPDAVGTPASVGGAGTRTVLSEPTNPDGSTIDPANLPGNPLKSIWAPRDAILILAKEAATTGVLPFDATRTAVFTTTDGSSGLGADPTKAVFTGADITYTDDAPYYFDAYYPAKATGTDPATLNDGFSYAGQVQRGNGDMRHLGDFDYMRATSSSSGSITSLADADLKFIRASAFFRFVITMPAADTPVSLNLTAVPPANSQALPVFFKNAFGSEATNSITLAFSDMTKLSFGQQLVAYLALRPGDLAATGLYFTLTLACADATYSCEVKGCSMPDGVGYMAGKVYDVAIDSDWHLTQSTPIVYTSSVALGSGSEPVLLKTGAPNSADNPYQIMFASNLRWLVKNVNEGGSFDNSDLAATAYYRLMRDIEINGPSLPSGGNPIDWMPIGTAGRPFRGHFDGAGHIITGLLRSSSDPNFGFFGFFGCVSSVVVSGSSPLPDIRNLTVMADVESNISSLRDQRYVGSIVGYTTGSATLDNCHFGGHLTAKGTAGVKSYVGGIAGAVGVSNERRSDDVSLITDCTTTSAATVGVDGISISVGNWVYVGGIAGECINAATVSGCTNGATVSGPIITSGDTQSEKITSFCTGGIAGYMKETSVGTGSIYRCTNNGAVTGGVYPNGITSTGGIAGYLNTTSASDLTNRGAVVAATGAEIRSCKTGGIVGHLFMFGGMESTVGPVSLIYATNEGPVSGGAATQMSYTGGIVGDNSDARAIHLCHNAGNVQSASGNNNAQYFGIGAWIGCNNTATSALYDCCTLAPSVTVDGAPADPQTNGIGTAIAGSSTQPQPCMEGHKGDVRMP
ncbi:hypothetical protein [Phocaeicola sp.]